MKAIGNIIIFAIYAMVILISIYGMPILVLHLLFMLIGAEKRDEKAKQKLQNSLMDGESIIASAIEMRPYALFSRRSLVAITNSRVIYFKRPILGGFSMIDVQWKDVTDAELSENIIPSLCGSKISISHSVDKTNFDINIASSLASQIYKRAQKEEQAWEEKRRVRNIEETRAAAGGTYITSPTESKTTQVGSVSILDEIKKAKELLDQEIISDVEFDELKSKILNQGRSI